MVGYAGFSHVWLTSVKEGFVIEVIYSTTQVHTKKWIVNMKTKTVSFSLVAIKFPFGLQNYWRKKNFLIPLTGLNWSVCLTFSVESLGKFYCFSKAESNNINSVQSRTQRLRPRPLIQSMIPGFFKLIIFRICTFEFSFWMRSVYKRVPALAFFHHRFCAACTQNVEVEPPWMYF